MSSFQLSGSGRGGGRGGVGRGRGGGGFGDSSNQEQVGYQQHPQEDSPSFREDARILSRSGVSGHMVGRRPGSTIRGYGGRDPAEEVQYQGQDPMDQPLPVPIVPRGGRGRGDPDYPLPVPIVPRGGRGRGDADAPLPMPIVPRGGRGRGDADYTLPVQIIPRGGYGRGDSSAPPVGPGRGRGGLQPQAQQPPQHEPPIQARQEVQPPAPGNVGAGTSRGPDVSTTMRSELINLCRQVSDAFNGFANKLENTKPTEYAKKSSDPSDPDFDEPADW